MVTITRWKSSEVNMSITAEVLEDFENLIKPLVTNQSLEGQFKEGIISNFENKLRKENLKIQESESKIHSKKSHLKK